MTAREAALPAQLSRWERQMEELLRELAACGHHSPQLLELAELPGFAHAPLFTWLGFVAKSDDLVTKRDIELSEALMRGLGLKGRKRRKAIRAFHRGRDNPRPPNASAIRLRLCSLILPGTALCVLMAVCNGAHVNGTASLERVRRAEQASRAFGLPLKAAQHILDSYKNKPWITRAGRAARLSYDEACQIIGVPVRTELHRIKLAYRRQVRDYHPDRLLSQNLSTTEFETAQARLLQLQEAWQVIRRYHRD